ncbi:MAG: type VI secretion system-associated FHA domain protein TagH, partial [Limnobacter sp.]|nr:type VI secretion system-associated FHA domain protein TagH [Limnobacter sp.]
VSTRESAPANPVPQAIPFPEGASTHENPLLRLKEGLGLSPHEQLDETQVYQLGRLMRKAVEGYLELLALRALFKREVRSDVTSIIARDNNPLKFCPNVDEAIRRLIAPSESGYLSPEEAIAESTRDLRGLQKAVAYALDQGFAKLAHDLEPSKFTPSGKLRSLLRWLPTSDAWARYETTYQTIFGQCHDPFESALGAVFREAFDREKESGDQAAAP